jgi:biotin transport system substrate-specific component
MESIQVRTMTLTAVMTALMCVLGPVMIPLGPIPFSLQVLTVCLSAAVLGMKRGTLATVLYLLIGFVGVPVFTGFSGGPGKILGPTGGFLVGFVPLSLIAGWASDHFRSSAVLQFLGMFVGLVVLYFFGTAWLVWLAKLPVGKALQAAVYPFVAVDTVKVLIAMFLSRALRSRLERIGA